MEAIRLIMRVEGRGISVLTRRDMGEMVSLFSMQGNIKKTDTCKLEGEPSPDPESVRTLILDFAATRLKRNKCLLFKIPGLPVFVIAD